MRLTRKVKMNLALMLVIYVSFTNYLNLSFQFFSLKQLLREKQDECNLITKQTIDDCIANIPMVQQELVKAIISVTKCKSIGRRYFLDWIYECLLINIKGPKLYKKLRVKNKLPLPSEITGKQVDT